MCLRRVWGFVLSVGLLLLSAAIVSAQVQSGRIVGVVTDPQHAAIPNATVTVTNTATNIAQTFTTDSNGNYVDTPLDPGTYSVAVTASGFQKTVRNGIELVVAQIAEVDMELAIGSTSTEVTVSAETPILSTESGALGTTITNHEVMDLPLNGRDYTKLAQLSPGDINPGATGNTQLVRPENVNGNVVNGVSGQMTVFLLDGAISPRSTRVARIFRLPSTRLANSTSKPTLTPPNIPDLEGRLTRRRNPERTNFTEIFSSFFAMRSSMPEITLRCRKTRRS